MVDQLDLLSDDGILIIERHNDEALDVLPKWNIIKSLSAGYTRVDFLCKQV